MSLVQLSAALALPKKRRLFLFGFSWEAVEYQIEPMHSITVALQAAEEVLGGLDASEESRRHQSRGPQLRDHGIVAVHDLYKGFEVADDETVLLLVEEMCPYGSNISCDYQVLSLDRELRARVSKKALVRTKDVLETMGTKQTVEIDQLLCGAEVYYGHGGMGCCDRYAALELLARLPIQMWHSTSLSIVPSL